MPEETRCWNDLAEENRRLRAALEEIIIEARVPESQYYRNGPQWTSPAGRELYDASYLHEKMEELAAIAVAAVGEPA